MAEQAQLNAALDLDRAIAELGIGRFVLEAGAGFAADFVRRLV